MVELTSGDFRKMLISGAKLLEINRPLVDSLNVFPVPDGDTGTNMSLTFSMAVQELGEIELECKRCGVCDGVFKGRAQRRSRQFGRYQFANFQRIRGCCDGK